MIQSRGVIRYSPKLLGEQPSENWWVVVDCDEAIGCYYRALFHLAHWRSQSLFRPSWAEHITVVRGEEPMADKKSAWEKYAGTSVDFLYSASVRDNGNYYWLDVECPRLLDLREELGLSRQPLYPLHLSIGHSGCSRQQ